MHEYEESSMNDIHISKISENQTGWSIESSPGLWFMVHGFDIGSVYDCVHGLVNGLVHGFIHDLWFIPTF